MAFSLQRHSARVAASLIAIFALGSCAENGAGPLATGDGSYVVGVQDPGDGRHPSLGTITLTNTSSTDEVVLKEVRLIGSDGIRVGDIYLVPALEFVDFGGGFSLPPKPEGFPHDSQNEQWAARTDFVDAILLPGEEANLLFDIRFDRPCAGSSKGVEVHYKVGSRRLVTSSNAGMERVLRDDEDCS